MRLVMELPGIPRGQRRVRATVRGRRAAVYKDEKQIAWEELTLVHLKPYTPEVPLTGPLQLTLMAVFPMPESWSEKKKREMDGALHTAKPDLDNLFKHVKDCMKMLCFYIDDAQICRYGISTKRYGRIARTYLILETVDE